MMPRLGKLHLHRALGEAEIKRKRWGVAFGTSGASHKAPFGVVRLPLAWLIVPRGCGNYTSADAIFRPLSHLLHPGRSAALGCVGLSWSSGCSSAECALEPSAPSVRILRGKAAAVGRVGVMEQSANHFRWRTCLPQPTAHSHTYTHTRQDNSVAGAASSAAIINVGPPL